MKDVRDSLGGAQGTGKTQKYVRVAPSFRYNAADCDYVLRIASQYALAYRDPNDNNSVFLPAMCRYGDKKPEDLCQPEKTAYRVVYELEYPYLSETVVQRLMLACLLRGYHRPACWRGGFRFEVPPCYGIVDTADNDRVLRLTLWSTSCESTLLDLLKWFHEQLVSPNASQDAPTEFLVCGAERYAVWKLLHARDRGITRVPKEFDPNTEFTVGELLGTFAAVIAPPERGVDYTWERFLVNHADSPQKVFELLRRDLFREEFFGGQCFLRSSPNNVGVEVEPETLPDGTRISFQAKFFLNNTDYTQILKSAEKIATHYKEKIDVVYLFCNRELDLHCQGYKKCLEVLGEIQMKPVTHQELLAPKLSNAIDPSDSDRRVQIALDNFGLFLLHFSSVLSKTTNIQI